MRALLRLITATGIAAALPVLLAAQEPWVAPQPPCDIAPGHAKVNGAIQSLKAAAEKPTERERQLQQARRVLIEAITQDGQDRNPAAWYYLGRYYIEASDAPGADTALSRAVALASQCRQDIDGYRERLLANTLDAGVAAWQEGRQDSALNLLRLAGRLDPTNPKPFAVLAGLYASKGNDDSALVYYRRAAQAAGNDTARAKEKREALANAWRMLVRRVQGHPAAQEAARLRARLDSLGRGLAGDSTVLARLVASSQSRKARGRTLTPADQRLFTRDSTARAEAVARARAGRSALVAQLAADSSTLVAAFAGAIGALREYLAAYRDAPDAATSLAVLYAHSGRAREAAAVFDSLVAHTRDLAPDELFRVGEQFVGQGFYLAGARALALGLERNPYRPDALRWLGVASYQLRDTAGLLPVARRLLELDPLSRTALKLVAAGWDLHGGRDSSAAYVARADATLAVEVAVSSFAPDSAGAAWLAVASNLKSAPSNAFRLVVEFLDRRGQIVATATHDVPALSPRQSHGIDLKVSGSGIAGWRYRS